MNLLLRRSKLSRRIHQAETHLYVGFIELLLIDEAEFGNSVLQQTVLFVAKNVWLEFDPIF